MLDQRNFIETRLGDFLRKSRNSTLSQGHIPPEPKEIKALIDYLEEKGLEPIIVGSVAVYSHLRKKRSDPKDLIAQQNN